MSVTRMSEPSWATNEAHLQIANTEPLYVRMLECSSPDDLRKQFGPGAVSLTYEEWRDVDWDVVFDWFEDDIKEPD